MAALLLLLFAARVALPGIAEDLLEQILSEALHVEFLAEDVSFDLLEGEVVVVDVEMRVVGAEEDLARAARIAIDVDWGALIMGELHAERIAIDGPKFFFETDVSGLLNWDALRGPAGEPREVSSAPTERGTFRVTSDRLDIGAGTFEFVDRTQGGLPDLVVAVGALQIEGAEIARETPADPVRWALGGAKATDWRLGVTPIGREEIAFEIQADAGPPADDGSMPLDLSMTREDGIELSLNGAIQLDPLAFELALEWKGLSSRSIAPLVLRGAHVERGTAQGALALKLDLGDVPDRGLKVTGNVRHDGLALHVDDDPEIDVVIDAFVGEIDEIWFPIPAETPEAPPPVRVTWKRIDLKKASVDVRPRGKGDAVEQPVAPVPPPDERSEEASPQDSAVEVAEIAPEVGEEATEREQAVEPPPVPPDVTIASFSLSEGRLVWHDPNLGANSEQVLSDIQLDASAVHWPPTTTEHATLTIGSLGAQPLRIEGQIRADGAELAVRGSGIKLVPWNPLITHYSDYSVSGGSFSIKSDFKLVADSYESPTRITLHRIQASTDGSGFRSTFGVPLAAATTLLSDPGGDIQLEIPVSGRLVAGGELQLGVSLVDAVREGITNALTSVVASPFTLAGSAVAYGHELAFLRIGEALFEPGSEDLEQAARGELDRAAEFVAKSPDARLELVAEVVASDLEAPAENAKRPNFFRSMLAGGAALFKGRRELDSESYLFALDLAKARTQAAADHLAATGVLAPERVVRTDWDEKVAAGSPRIVLRLDMSPDEDDD